MMLTKTDVLIAAVYATQAMAQSLTNKMVLPSKILDWLRVQDEGFVSPKVGVSKIDAGLVALYDIKEGEPILVIPSEAEFRGFSPRKVSACETAWSFLLEYSLGSESSPNYSIYADFLLSFSEHVHEDLPKTSVWSYEAKAWIQHNLMEIDLEPIVFGGEGAEECAAPPYQQAILDTEENWELLPEVVDLVNTVGWSKTLIPIYDVIQRNHSLANVEINENERIFGFHDETVVKATQFIPEGSGLYTSFDSPATFFHLYGEIQPYPHRWFFQTGHEGRENGTPHNGVGLIYEVCRNENDGNYNVRWISGEPNENQLTWLMSRRQQLQVLDVHADSGIQSSHEIEMAYEYQKLLLTDLDQAILTACGNFHSENPHVCSVNVDLERATDSTPGIRHQRDSAMHGYYNDYDDNNNMSTESLDGKFESFSSSFSSNADSRGFYDSSNQEMGLAQLQIPSSSTTDNCWLSRNGKNYCLAFGEPEDDDDDDDDALM